MGNGWLHLQKNAKYKDVCHLLKKIFKKATSFISSLLPFFPLQALPSSISGKHFTLPYNCAQKICELN